MTEFVDAHDPAVTVMITRRVKPGREDELEAFLLGVTAACSQFPGHLGTTIFRPTQVDDREYRIIFKFDRHSHLQQWHLSEERQRWFAIAAELTECPPDIQVLTGLETWFTLPGKTSMTPPPRYKMALVSWLAVFPLITLISTLLKPELEHLPLVLRTLTITAIAIPSMTYLIMPQMTRLFAHWLYPNPADAEIEQSLPTLAATPLVNLPDLPEPLNTRVEAEIGIQD